MAEPAAHRARFERSPRKGMALGVSAERHVAGRGVSTIDVLVGGAARDLLHAGEFDVAWRRLASEASYATGFQSPGFVVPWYETYRTVYDPVIVRAVAEGGALVGCWFLAFDARRGRLIHAGGHQAEYEVWLAFPGFEVAFLVRAWRALRRSLRFETLEFSYLPSTHLLRELLRVPALRRAAVWRLHRRPILRLERAAIAASLAKKSNRSRMNRLRRLGAVECRRLVSTDELARVFDALIGFYDFRQAAVHGVTPFMHDPLKRKFHSAVLAAAPSEAHVTVSYLNGEPIAGLWGTMTNKTLHVGMIMHSPLLAEHSPGKLHILQAAELLLNEGGERIDFTPGGDAWKERFANEHDDVAWVVLHRSSLAALRVRLVRTLRTSIKRGSRLLGLDLGRLRRGTTVRPVGLPGARRGRAAGGCWYRIDRPAAGNVACADPGFEISCNSVRDLVRARDADGRVATAFLSDALAHLEAGETVYSVCMDGRLAHSVWVAPHPPASLAAAAERGEVLRAGAVFASDPWPDPASRGRGVMQATLCRLLADAFASGTVPCVYAVLPEPEDDTVRMLKRMGLRVDGLGAPRA